MNRKILSTLTLALAALASGHAMAQSTTHIDALAQVQQAHPSSFAAKTTSQLSRAAVQADLREARRSGEVVANGEAGIPQNEMFPGQYPTQVAERSMSREEVRADLREAMRTGEVVANGETGMKLNEVFPGRYANKS
jgi:lambda repressor-like predicted transcriptional regulator